MLATQTDTKSASSSKPLKAQAKRPVVGRFAPSPTGRMHAGNIYAALIAWLFAKSQNGEVVLRIEDLDTQRSKPLCISQVQRDFEALGLTWDRGPYFQSNRSSVYAQALHELKAHNVLYPCFCSRASLHAASAPHKGEKPIYQGTCRHLTHQEREVLHASKEPALRILVPSKRFAFEDVIQGHYEQNLAADCGDFVLQRADGTFAYQLAVVVDDAEQGVNQVVRGLDLLSSTPQQLFLQEELGFERPSYAHIPLLVAEDGRRLSKRNHDACLDELYAHYKSPEGVLGHVAFLAGLLEQDEPASAQELLKSFDGARFVHKLASAHEIPWSNL